jgi:hypothetical protein
MRTAAARLTCVLSDGEPIFYCATTPAEAGIPLARLSVLATHTSQDVAFDLVCEALLRCRRGRAASDPSRGR